MKKFSILFLFSFLLLISLLTAEWKPVKPITIIVPWSAGGSTDLTTRTLASEMEKYLGQKIVVVNTPGAAGSIGMKNAWDSPHDGYTWAANAVVDVVKYAVLGYFEVTHRDWITFWVIYAPNVICVRPDSKYKSVKDLVEEMKKRPGEVTVATAGIGSAGHIAIELFSIYFNVKYRHVPYAGGYPAVIATVGGETEVVTQLSMEVAEMLRAGKLRALATLSGRSFTISGYGRIPTIRTWYPDYPETGAYFGIMLPRDTPKEVISAVTKAFVKSAYSDTVKSYAEKNGLIQVCIYGKKAEELNEEVASRICWLLYDQGIAKISPEKFNIPRKR
ncbi:MAG: tripartite tricarboxylate transporter substrate binding protein [Dictyoglomaceae bacterium]